MRANATTPIATPPSEATTRSTPTDDTVTRSTAPPCAPAPWTASPAAARAVRSVTSAVASLRSDSPSRIVVMERGRPIRRATAVAATASGGETMAPRATASANGMGSSSQATTPTPSAVKRTSPTDRLRILARKVRMSMSELDRAAAYSSGGSSPRRTTSLDRRTSGTPGRNDSTAPAASRASGVGSGRGAAARLTRMTTRTTATSSRAISTGGSCPLGRRVGEGCPGQPSTAVRRTSRPTDPTSSARRWKSLSENASPSRAETSSRSWSQRRSPIL